MEELRQIIEKEARAILNIPITDGYEKAIELMYEHVHVKKGKVIAAGVGKAGQIALNIATTFSSTGTPAVFLHPADAQHGDLGVIQPDDVLLLISNSGKTREVIELVQLVRNLYVQIPYVLITGNLDSPLAKDAFVVLHTGAPEEVCPLGLTPTTSTTVMTVIGDMLITSMMRKIGFTAEEYAKRHHAGYLGQKSRELTNNNIKI